MELETKWSVNESLLQSYRSIFISSQSFLLAVGAVLIEKYPYLNIAIAVLSVLMIWWIWIPVVKARRRIVDYYKYALKLDDEQSAFFLKKYSEHVYVRNGTQREEANQFLQETIGESKPITDLRETRKKVDVYLPIGFSIIWLLFIFISIIQIVELSVK